MLWLCLNEYRSVNSRRGEGDESIPEVLCGGSFIGGRHADILMLSHQKIYYCNPCHLRIPSFPGTAGPDSDTLSVS